MNERADPSIPEPDEWLDGVLRTSLRDDADYIADDGFTARVMAALPPPDTLPAWRKPALAALWAVAGLGIAAALPSVVTDVAHDMLRLVMGQRLSLAEIAAAALAFGAVTWTGAAMALRRD
jgi:hypothetical protein